MTERRLTVVLPAVVAAPVWLAASGLMLFSLLDMTGRMPFSDGPLRNVAEAAADGNAAEVVRRLNAGADLRQAMPVRAELISSSVRYAAALEAAVWSRQGALVRLLDRLGAVGHGATRRHLVCLALDIGAEEVSSVLDPGGAMSCVPAVATGIVTGRDTDERVPE